MKNISNLSNQLLNVGERLQAGAALNPENLSDSDVHKLNAAKVLLDNAARIASDAASMVGDIRV